MQTQWQQWLNKVAEYLDVAVSWLERALYQLWQWIRKAYAWYKSIDFPEIPLTPLQWVMSFYVIFGVLYMVSTPIFEASDEMWHFGMVEYIRENGELPVQDPDPDTPVTIYRQEGSQPPLYYAAMALLTAPIDISDAEQYREPNPHARAGEPGSYGNKNLVLHSTDGVPLQGTPLAVYLIRAAGLLMGLGTIWAVYQCGNLVAPHRSVVGLVAAGITAFNPMFIFISASVNNDNLVILLCSVAIWLMLLTLKHGFETRRSVALAVLIGLAALTKLSALVLVPPIALGGLWIAQRDDDWRGVFVLGGAMLVAWATISGWWYLRNIQEYGELFGTATMAAVANRGIPREVTFLSLLGEFEGFRFSYWGIFGAFNIQTTRIFYALADLFVVTSIAGVLFLVAQLLAIRDFSYARRELTYLLFLLGIVLVGLVAFITWTIQTPASQGRLLFPYIAAISPLLAVGFVEFIWWGLFVLSPPDRSFVQAGDAVPENVLRQAINWVPRVFGFLALLIPIATIAPQYDAPPPLDALPDEGITPVYANYGDVELVGYDYVDRRYFPGDTVRMTFYWHVLEQSEQDNSFGFVLVDPFGTRLGSIDTYPGAGTLRTTTWEAGKFYADTYEIELTRNMQGRFPFDAQLSWYQGTPDALFTARDADENVLNTVLLDAGAFVRPGVTAPAEGFVTLVTTENPLSSRSFNDLLAVTGYNITVDPLTISVEWEARNGIETDYTTFLHVVDDDENIVAQADIFPRFPTHYWTFAERYVIDHPIDFDERLDEGTYSVRVGWYENLGNEFPRLLIQPGSEEERSYYELLTFEVNDEGTLLFPQPETADGEVSPEAVPQPGSEVTEETEADAEATVDAESTDDVESDE